MGYERTILFLVACASINSVQSHSTCNLEDIACTTRNAQKLLNSVVKGLDGFFEPLDPLSLSDVDSKYIDLDYIITNSTLTGVSKCVVKSLKFNTKDFTGHCEILCPKLDIKYYYEFKGGLGPTETDGTGIVQLDDYFISADTSFRMFTSKKDNKPHLTFLNYRPTFEPKGPVTIDVDGAIHSVPKTDAHAKENARKTSLDDLEKILRVMHMPGYFELVMKAVNSYLNEVPFDEIFQE